jgi:hypothetical protein
LKDLLISMIVIRNIEENSLTVEAVSRYKVTLAAFRQRGYLHDSPEDGVMGQSRHPGSPAMLLRS